MKTFRLYLDDLTPEARSRLLQFYGEDWNYDTIPITILELEEEEQS